MRAATSMTWKWWLNSELRRTLLGFSEALICLSYSAVKLVPPRGNAPRSISNRLMALLLSYEGYCHKKSPVKVTHPRLPGVGRARYYYANGRKVVTASGLSPDRTELRTRVREMLCICGGTAYEMAEHQRIALWTRLSAAVFETVSSSMPDVLHESGSQSRSRTYTPCGT